MATATDFQSLLSSPNVACYLNLSPGEWMGVKLALLQDIARSLGVGVTTLNTSGLIYGPPGIGILHYVAVPVTSGGTYVVTPGVNENGIYLDLTGDGLAAQIATGTLLANGVSITVTAVGSYLYFEGGHLGSPFTGVITQDPFTPSNLLITQNVACYANLPPGMQEGIKLALLQDILLGIGSGGGSSWTPSTPISGATLVEWLSGNSINQASGTSVATWPAYVGQNAIQPGSTAQPTLIIGAYPNPVVRFNGTSTLMGLETSISVPTQPFSIAMFFKDNGTGNSNLIDGGGSGGIGTLSGEFYAFAPTAVNLQAHDNNPHIMMAVFNGASSKFAFDSGTVLMMSSSPGTDTWANGNLNIGAGTLSLYAQVDIGEIIIWEGDVSTSWSTILAYLLLRW